MRQRKLDRPSGECGLGLRPRNAAERARVFERSGVCEHAGGGAARRRASVLGSMIPAWFRRTVSRAWPSWAITQTSWCVPQRG